MSASPEESRFYEPTVKRVLAGEPRQEVMHRLAVNEVPDEEAEAIYAAACRERLSAIRGHAWGIFRKGLVFSCAAGTVIFCVSYAMTHRFQDETSEILANKALLGIVTFIGFGLLFGIWKMIDGISGVLMAPKKEGPVDAGP